MIFGLIVAVFYYSFIGLGLAEVRRDLFCPVVFLLLSLLSFFCPPKKKKTREDHRRQENESLGLLARARQK